MPSSTPHPEADPRADSKPHARPHADPTEAPPPDVLLHELVQSRSALLRVARARLRNADWADEAVAETMLAVLERRPPFAEAARLRAWIFGILRHKVVDQLRLNLGAVAGEGEGDGDAAISILPTDGLDDPLRRASDAQLRGALATQLAQLPPRQARAFELFEGLGRSAQEVCAELAMTPGALYVAVHRARMRLREGLQAFRP